jgi:hypothetical protein
MSQHWGGCQSSALGGNRAGKLGGTPAAWRMSSGTSAEVSRYPIRTGQRRCSPSRSLTVPCVFSRPGADCLGCWAGRALPSASSCFSRVGRLTGTIRAIGWPWSVTVTMWPARTSARCLLKPSLKSSTPTFTPHVGGLSAYAVCSHRVRYQPIGPFAHDVAKGGGRRQPVEVTAGRRGRVRRPADSTQPRGAGQAARQRACRSPSHADSFTRRTAPGLGRGKDEAVACCPTVHRIDGDGDWSTAPNAMVSKLKAYSPQRRRDGVPPQSPRRPAPRRTALSIPRLCSASRARSDGRTTAGRARQTARPCRTSGPRRRDGG